MLRKIFTKISTKILGCLLLSKLQKAVASKSRRLGILISFIGTLLLILCIVQLVNEIIIRNWIYMYFLKLGFLEALKQSVYESLVS